MLDPASSSAHRFLSDVYQGEPRLEAARVSELLQSQLLQPVGMNPVQPSLGFADLNVIANAGPAHVGFNEFTPLFQQDGWQINGTGVVGTQNTIGNELTATALWGRTSVSVGQYYFDTDGFRANDHLQHKIYSMFGQVQATDNLGLQAEYRRRETNQGDRTLNFDPDDFRRNFDREHRPGSCCGSAASWICRRRRRVLMSAVHGSRNEHDQSFETLDFGPGAQFGFDLRNPGDLDGNQVEGQVLEQLRRDATRGRCGLLQRRRQFADHPDHHAPDGSSSTDDLVTDQHQNTDSANLYAYTYTNWPERVIWTLGMGGERTDVPGRRDTEPTPKFGVEYRATDRLTLRGAAFRTVKSNVVAQQTIQPTLVAGFNQIYDDFNGTKADQGAVGVDLKLRSDLTIGVEAIYREHLRARDPQRRDRQ